MSTNFRILGAGIWGMAFSDYLAQLGHNIEVFCRDSNSYGSKDFLKRIEFEKSKMNIQRFKGLGEMNPEELWSTTLNPETRNLLQVQYSKDLKKDQNLIHTLMGNDVALRKDFIVSNAINVQNLDI